MICMPELINVKEIGKEILTELEHFNKKIWDAISFRLVHATLSEEKELKSSYAKVQSHRKQRFEKALLQAKGNKRKTHELIASEDFI